MNFTRVAGLLLLLAIHSGIAQASLEDELRNISEHLVLDGDGQLPSGGVVYQPTIVEEFYFGDKYQPVWTERDQADKVLEILASAAKDGLDPEDYHYTILKMMLDQHKVAQKTSDRSRAIFDILLSDGVILYIRHLSQGKVDPRQMDASFNYSRREFEPKQVSTALRKAVREDTIANIMKQARPQQRFYAQMKTALARYRDLAAREVFIDIPDDVVLKPGNDHSNVLALRKRLAETGHLDAAAVSSSQFDKQLEEAVRRFQEDNDLDVDGIVGKQSYALLNMSWADRVDTLRLNMDRLRWIYRDISDDFIVVNIAGFELYYIRNNELVWDTPVMTGTIAHQTPVFTERLKYLEFNPTWTVPRSIIRRSLFPKFSANPQYVVDNNYHLIDREGQQADPLAIDWSAYNGSNFPYGVVQQPGENNALGRVKFIFPNRHAIYLHDTPSRALFSRSSRAFSSGCVRVKNPLQFAEILLDDPKQWSLQQVRDLVESGKPKERVYLQREMDVMLMYWTTSPTADGGVQFHPDIYNKDPAMLTALNAPPPIY
jgi:murein L,D-transpeptidase YcbB/YkuD